VSPNQQSQSTLFLAVVVQHFNELDMEQQKDFAQHAKNSGQTHFVIRKRSPDVIKRLDAELQKEELS
jgi:3-methyladenine DNA glycosylase AlkC